MSKEEKSFVDFVIYKGEKKNGTIVIKNEKPNSLLRIFSYEKGKKYRVGTDIHTKQAQFLTRNHNDLFRLEQIEVKGTDLILTDLELIIPRFQREINKPIEITFRHICEASLKLLGVDLNLDNPVSCMEKMVNILEKGYGVIPQEEEVENEEEFPDKEMKEEEEVSQKKLLRRKK